MKAQVKKTGKVIEVETIYEEYKQIHDYININSNKRYKKDELDFEDIIDWEQRRYEIAKDVLADCMNYPGDVRAIECAIELADALIEELKKEK